MSLFVRVRYLDSLTGYKWHFHITFVVSNHTKLSMVPAGPFCVLSSSIVSTLDRWMLMKILVTLFEFMHMDGQ